MGNHRGLAIFFYVMLLSALSVGTVLFSIGNGSEGSSPVQGPTPEDPFQARTRTPTLTPGGDVTSGKSPQGLATPQEGQPLASSASTGRDDAGANNPAPTPPITAGGAQVSGAVGGNFQPPQADGTGREAALAETHPPATGATTTSGLESPAPLLAARVLWSNGIARTVRDRVPIPASWGPDPESQALDFFDAYGSQFGIDDARQQLTVSSVVRTPEGSSVVTLDRVHEGRPVFGAQARVHIASSGDITFVSASFPNTIQVPQEADVSHTQALDLTRADLAEGGYQGIRLIEAELGVFSEEIFTGEGQDVSLAWRVTADVLDPPGAIVSFVEASSGELAFRYDNLQSEGRRTSSALGGSDRNAIYEGQAELWFTEDGQVTGTRPTKGGREAQRSLALVQRYYREQFGRLSYDDAGSAVDTFVDFRWVDGGRESPNAFWDGRAVWFTEGMVSLDVLAHELTHGVIDHSASLVYAYQSGALNESIADVFAAFIESWAGEDDAWLFGEDTSFGPFRDLSRPAAYDQPASMRDFLNARMEEDNGGIHTNSSIPSLAAHLITEGGTHPGSGVAVRGIGRAKAERIYYKALTEFLGPTTNFLDARDALVASCAELAEFGAKSLGITFRDCGAVSNGFAAVGIGEIDSDGDSWEDGLDNCRTIYNPDQRDRDSDGIGNACRSGTSAPAGDASYLFPEFVADFPRLTFLKHRGFETNEGEYWIVGELLNDGIDPVLPPIVWVNWYDDDGRLVWPERPGSRIGAYYTREPLAPGERTAYAVRLPRGVPASTFELRAAPPVISLVQPDPSVLTIADSFLTRDADGRYAVRGLLRNQSDETVTLSGIRVTFYDDSGAPIGLAAARDTRTLHALDRGQEATFELTLPMASAEARPASYQVRAWTRSYGIADDSGSGEAQTQTQIRIVTHGVQVTPQGEAFLLGEVQNTGMRPVRDLTVSALLPQQTLSGPALKLLVAPGEWSTFSIPLGGTLLPERVSLTAEGQVYPKGPARISIVGPEALAIVAQDLSTPQGERVTISAVLRNTQHASVKDITIVGTVFDRDGKVIWTDRRPFATLLEPGEEASFTWLIDASYADAAFVGLYAQGLCDDCAG